jgi:hypothetical protein
MCSLTLLTLFVLEVLHGRESSTAGKNLVTQASMVTSLHRIPVLVVLLRLLV